PAVAVEVRREHGIGYRSGGEPDLVLERSIAPPQEQGHTKVLGALIGGDQVELAVAVEVAGDEAEGQGAHGVVLPLVKSTVHVAQEHGNVVVRGEETGDGQVRVAVVVEVADGAAGRRTLQPKPSRTPKGPVAIPQDERNTERVLTTVNEVEMTVAVKIGGEHELTGSTGGEAHQALKGPVAAAQQHGKVRGVTVGRYQVQPSVPVHVRRQE